MYQLPIPNFYYLFLPSCVPPSLLFTSVMLDGLLSAFSFCPLYSPSPFFVCPCLHAASAFAEALSFSLHSFSYYNLVSNLLPFNYSLSPFFIYPRILIPHLLYVFDLLPSGHSRHNRSFILFSLFFTYLLSHISLYFLCFFIL